MLQQVYHLGNARLCHNLLRSIRFFHVDPTALNVTQKAAAKLKQIAEEGECLRITVEGGGCAGFEYKLKLDKSRLPDDVLIQKEGANVVVDEISLDFLRGSTIDYTEELMRSAFRIVNNPLSTQDCSCGSSFAPKEFDQNSSAESLKLSSESSSKLEQVLQKASQDFNSKTAHGSGQGQRKEKAGDDQKEHDDKKKGPGGGASFSDATKPLLGVSLATMIKDFFTYRPDLDEDPLKNKVKQAMLFRGRNQYEQALLILEEVLEEVQAKGDQLPITRVYYELAFTYYLQEDLEKASELFRVVISRLIQLHGKTDGSPEFIGISLKLADILARQGNIRDAEIGLRHCVSRQMAITEEHMKKYLVSQGAFQEQTHKVEVFGSVYSDPLALFGMCLEQLAHFLIKYFDESREVEACEYMDEVLKLSFHLYGPSSFHAVHILNNFGAICILRNRFKSALTYLAVGIDRIVHIDGCEDIIVGYYCNYAEALFHSDQIDESLKYAEKAVALSKSAPESMQRYAKKYFKDLKRDQWEARKRLDQAN